MNTPTTSEEENRSVVTDTPQFTNVELTIDATNAVSKSTPTTSEERTRSVVTDNSPTTNKKQTHDEPETHSIKNENTSSQKPRSVLTNEPADSTNNKLILDDETKNNKETQSNIPSPMSPNEDNVHANTRIPHHVALPNYNSDELPDLILPNTRSVVTSPRTPHIAYSNSGTEQTPNRAQSESMSQPSTTPRSVLSDPDDTEIETANTLLSLGSLESIDQTVDNETLLPVDKPRIRDFTQELAAQECTKQLEDESDSDITVAYGENQSDNTSTTAEPRSPKGVFRSKHYGIKRQSPTQSKVRHLRCLVCDTIFDSKREINKHHRTEHTKVACPDCRRTFPTPDALSHHRYIHKTDHQHICKYCDKKCAFESDLTRHMEKHREESPWTCDKDNCGRIFKRKAELIAHEVTHTGETFMCEYPGCDFTNKDPRNVKRHHRVHTKEKKVKCKKCDELFVFYMQMKRHLERDH